MLWYKKATVQTLLNPYDRVALQDAIVKKYKADRAAKGLPADLRNLADLFLEISSIDELRTLAEDMGAIAKPQAIDEDPSLLDDLPEDSSWRSEWRDYSPENLPAIEPSALPKPGPAAQQPSPSPALRLPSPEKAERGRWNLWRKLTRR